MTAVKRFHKYLTSLSFRRIIKSEYLVLFFILILAFYMAYIPHSGQPYPVHHDEWIHMACANEIIDQSDAFDITNPLYGTYASHNQVFEVGFHVFWATFHQISGIPWIDIFKYFPGIMFVFTVLSVYILGRRHGFGLESALFMCLIPTTVGILGPGFLVPVGLGLLFIALSLFLVLYFRTRRAYLALLLCIGCLFTMHPVTALILLIMFVPFYLLSFKEDLKYCLILAGLIGVFFVIVFYVVPDIKAPVISFLPRYTPINPYIDLPEIVPMLGYPAIILSLLGIMVLGIKGGKSSYSLVLALLSLLVVLVTFFSLHYGISFLYYRGLLVLIMMLYIFTGVGIAGIRKLRLPARCNAWLKFSVIYNNIGNVISLGLVIFIFVVTIPLRQDTPYYYMIDTEDYESFVWIKDNIDEQYQKAILDPWKATAFSAVTGKYIYSAISEFPTAQDQQAAAFLYSGCADTTFLTDNGISIVYTRQECTNPDLEEVAQNVYVLTTDPLPKSE